MINVWNLVDNNLPNTKINAFGERVSNYVLVVYMWPPYVLPEIGMGRFNMSSKGSGWIVDAAHNCTHFIEHFDGIVLAWRYVDDMLEEAEQIIKKVKGENYGLLR